MMHYLQDQNHNGLHHHHLSNGNAIDQDEHGENNNIGTSGGVDEVMDGDVGANMGSQTDNGALIPHVGGSENGDQLTLSFQGQVYVFDSVSPEKVPAFLYKINCHDHLSLYIDQCDMVDRVNFECIGF